MKSSGYIPLKVIQIREETADTKSFVLTQVSGKPIRYKPGQFLTLIFNKKNTEERRSYSISSTPCLNEPLTITVKRIDNGEYSRYLFDSVRKDDMLLTIGASGYFTLPEHLHPNAQLFFIAAGSGITPIFPLIKTILYTEPAAKVFLIYSSRSVEKTIFYTEIEALANKFKTNFIVEIRLSSAQNLLKARLSKVFLLQLVEETNARENNALFFICGPFQYMQMVTIALLTAGIPTEHIRKENFSTEKPVVKTLPPDLNAHAVHIHFSGKQYHLTVQYPDTILQTAKQAGLPLPYSCEAGKCGTCSATCLQGKVWHSYNEVLLDRELEHGRILTCTGYPYGAEDIILTFPETNRP